MKTITRTNIVNTLAGTLDILPKRLVPMARQVAWKFLSPKVPVISGISQCLRGDSDWIVYQEIFVEQQYDLAITQSLLDSKKLSVIHVVDIGANVGFFTSRYITLFSKAYLNQKKLTMTLVEGSPPTAEILQKAMHGAHGQIEVNVINGLAGRCEGTGYIQSNQQFSGVTKRLEHSTPKSESVAYVDIDLLTKTSPEISLLKCDIEGSEELFIESNEPILRRTRNAVFEFHPDLCDVRRCVELLKSFGLVHVSTEVGELFTSRSVDFFKRQETNESVDDQVHEKTLSRS